MEDSFRMQTRRRRAQLVAHWRYVHGSPAAPEKPPPAPPTEEHLPPDEFMQHMRAHYR